MKVLMTFLSAIILVTAVGIGLQERSPNPWSPNYVPQDLPLIQSCGKTLVSRVAMFEEALIRNDLAFQKLQNSLGSNVAEDVFWPYLNTSEQAVEDYVSAAENYNKCLDYRQMFPDITPAESELQLNKLVEAYNKLATFEAIKRPRQEFVDKAYFKLLGKHAPALPQLPPLLPPPKQEPALIK